MKIKKLGALLVSAALCAGMAAPAFAFEGEAAPVEQPVLPEVDHALRAHEQDEQRHQQVEYHDHGNCQVKLHRFSPFSHHIEEFPGLRSPFPSKFTVKRLCRKILTVC